jgi:hypothetical protein
MTHDLLSTIKRQINFILEHEDGLSAHDKTELNELLLRKVKLEKELGKLSDDLNILIN